MTCILVAEDHEDILYLIEKRLRQAGFDVLPTTNGQAAVELTLARRPQLVVLDMNLPLLEGWEAARQIKSQPGLREISIIALSAYTFPGDKARALQAGCDAHLAKPIDFQTLFSTIHHLLEVRSR